MINKKLMTAAMLATFAAGTQADILGAIGAAMTVGGVQNQYVLIQIALRRLDGVEGDLEGSCGIAGLVGVRRA